MSDLAVALDARCLQDEPLGGVGRSTRAVVAAVRDHVDLVLLTDARRPPVDTDLPQRALRAPLSGTKAAWLQLAAPRELRRFRGIFHCPWYGLPFRQPVPMVVTIYDLTFVHGRTGFRPDQWLAYRVQARWAARTAAHVLTGSDAVRRELLARYRLDPTAVSVQPSPVDPRAIEVDPNRVDALRERLALRGRYVVAVGGAPRRRLDLALAAWPSIHARVPDATLVVVGEDTASLPSGALAAGVVDDGDWAAVLAGADALVYPTEYEGLGYPALEAMVLGTPVVAARVGALPELLGDAGCWIERHEPAALATATARVLTEPDLADRLRSAGRARSQPAASLEGLRACLLDAYERAVARPRSGSG